MSNLFRNFGDRISLSVAVMLIAAAALVLYVYETVQAQASPSSVNKLSTIALVDGPDCSSVSEQEDGQIYFVGCGGFF